MDIRHGKRCRDDAWQVCDVGGLLRPLVTNDLRDHLFRGVNARGHAHAAALR
jgi:hypothetical protein